jgi:hypothetical protein
VHEDIVWIYRTPLPESQKIAGLACFYDEKADVYLDGELQDKPATPFSGRHRSAVATEQADLDAGPIQAPS